MTTTQPDTDTTQIAELTRAWRSIDLRRTELVDQQNEIRSRIRKLLVPGDRVDVDGKVVACQANRRFDVEQAAALLEPAVRDLCYTTALDPAKVKEHLTPALRNACMVEQGEPKVVLG